MHMCMHDVSELKHSNKILVNNSNNEIGLYFGI